MARRYIRTVGVQLCSDDEIDSRADELTRLVDGLVVDLCNSGGWEVARREDSDEDIEVHIRIGTFQGKITAARQSDIGQEPGKGSWREINVRIGAECFNSKRRQARELQQGMQQGTSHVFGVIGGIAAGLLWCVFEAVLLGSVHVVMPVIAFCFGYGIAAAIGHILGRKVGSTVGKGVAATDDSEEEVFDGAGDEWEGFIARLAEQVDEIAVHVEEIPSSATMM
jgi:hypothetical protein